MDSEVQADKLNHDSLIEAVLKHELYHGDFLSTTNELKEFLKIDWESVYKLNCATSNRGAMTAEALERCIENYKTIVMEYNLQKDIINTLLDRLYGNTNHFATDLLEHLEQQRICEEIYSLMKEIQKYSEPIPVIDLEKSIKQLEEIPNLDNYKPDEKDLKKRIKHSKTPMERKMYEKQLNELYKKRKKKKI